MKWKYSFHLDVDMETAELNYNTDTDTNDGKSEAGASSDVGTALFEGEKRGTFFLFDVFLWVYEYYKQMKISTLTAN